MHSLRTDTDPMGRARSSTVGSSHPQLSDVSSFREFGAFTDFPASPNPMKSQFDDDSEDEEKLEAGHRSLAGVPHRARLAEIGTASRLFKGKRHSRTPSNGQTSTFNLHDVISPLKIDKRINKQRDAMDARPMTSDGVSPSPRRAIFGHRPSPSELSQLTPSSKSRSIPPADRDIILSLRGDAPKPRPKAVHKKKSLPKAPEQHSYIHQRQGSASTTSTAPPPYCFAENESPSRSESLRKSQSLSTLRTEAQRRAKQLSPTPEMPTSVPADDTQHANRSAWEAMLSTSPSVASDRSSRSSYGQVTRAQIVAHASPKRTPKKEHLPPQKPPPRSCPPPPPPPPPRLKSDSSEFQAVSSAKSSLESVSPSLKSDYDDRKKLAKIVEQEPSSFAATSQSASTPSSSSTSNTAANSGFCAAHSDQVDSCQIELNVGGTKLVTLLSTLRGQPGDHPRLFADLLPRENLSSELMRRNRVSIAHRSGRNRSGSDSSTRTSLDASTAEKLSAALQEARDPRSSSSSLTNEDSDNSMRRTSDLSSASSAWSHADHDKPAPGDAADPTVQELQPPSSSDFASALPSSRLCSPQAFPPSPLPTPQQTKQIFLDRNPDVYHDILDILRARKLPYRLLAASIASAVAEQDGPGGWELTIKMQLRCRLHEIREEAEWLGYPSIIALCHHEISRF